MHLDRNVSDFLVHKMEMVVKALELVVDKWVVIVIVMRSNFVQNLSAFAGNFFFLSPFSLVCVRLGKWQGSKFWVGEGAKQWISMTWCAKSFVCKSFRSFMPFHSQQFNHLTFHLSRFHTHSNTHSIFFISIFSKIYSLRKQKKGFQFRSGTHDPFSRRFYCLRACFFSCRVQCSMNDCSRA